ncbi:MAG: hypothetical protein M3R36_06650 [Bacteroidota bacterium]|nr:hypothetical protein [Bacteroidota bacterium]
MQRKLTKYLTKFISLIILISFISSSAGWCELYMSSCNTQSKASCCCKDSDTDFSVPIKIERKCCCEIKASATQPAEINLRLTESLPKTQSYFVKANFYNADINELNANRLEFRSAHPPPGKDIYLFNSNLRI